jgi:hypothetical protein
VTTTIFPFAWFDSIKQTVCIWDLLEPVARKRVIIMSRAYSS